MSEKKLTPPEVNQENDQEKFINSEIEAGDTNLSLAYRIGLKVGMAKQKFEVAAPSAGEKPKKHPGLEERRKNIPQSFKDEIDAEFSKLNSAGESKPEFEAMAIESYPLNNELQEVFESGLGNGYELGWQDRQKEIDLLKEQLSKVNWFEQRNHMFYEQIESLELQLKEATEEIKELKEQLALWKQSF